MKYVKKNIKYLSFFLLLLTFSCKKLITVPAPYISLSQQNVYANDASAIAVLTGIYSDMSNGSVNGPVNGPASFTFYGALSSDELTLYSGVTWTPAIAYYKNDLKVINSGTTYGTENWGSIYNYIFRTNAAIEGLNNSKTLTPTIKQQLLGEAQFLRAFYYFFLVNYYGDVPLALTTDYKKNSGLARSTRVQVYEQIINDLKSAQNSLSSNFLDASLTVSTLERVRPTKWVATALLARVYLYYGNLTGDAGNYQNAITQSATVIKNSVLFGLDSLNGIFLKNSSEAIWQLQPTTYGYNTLDAQLYVITSTGPTDYVGGLPGNPVYLSKSLLNAFESKDLRRLEWVDSVSVSGTTYYYPFKYKNYLLNNSVTEYLMVFRLGEQYLIRAEAEAETGSGNAIADLNIIRGRAGLPNYQGGQVLSAIQHERQVELFTEGHRWLDLKRTASVDSTMNKVCPLKGSTWKSNQQLYPLPLSDILEDKNLVQNPGY